MPTSASPSPVIPGVEIVYCSLCHFAGPAQEIARRIREEFGLECEVRPGYWGSFRITWGNRVIFNRWSDRGWLGWIGFGTNISPAEIIQRLKTAGAVPIAGTK